MGQLDFLFPRARARLFRELFTGTGNEIHLRQLARQCGVAVGTLQDEVSQLQSAGLLKSRREGNRLYYQANEGHPLFPEIHHLVRKTSPPRPSKKKPRTSVPGSGAAQTLVRPARPSDRGAWLRMRRGLWPGHADHPDETRAYFSRMPPDAVVLVAEHKNGALVGFLEIGLRDYAEGCTSSPVAYLEGWWVEAAHRRSGVGRALVQGAETWARGHGLTELASDCAIDNIASAAAHSGCGFTESDRIVCFLKSL